MTSSNAFFIIMSLVVISGSPRLKSIISSNFFIRSFIVGENRTGKSTIFKAIVVLSGFNAEGETKNFNFAINIDDLEKEIPGLLSYYGRRSLDKQSHGESFFLVFLNRKQGEAIFQKQDF